MKKLIISILFLLIYSSIYSQDISYISVSPKYNFEVTEENIPYNNVCMFEFFLNTIEAYQSQNCYISFSFDELGEYGVVALTGLEGEYTEDRRYYNITTMDSSYCDLSISTLNLPELKILIGYNGYKRKIKINDVTISFRGKKY